MRFSLNFELKNNIIPIEYRRVILSYIKNALHQCNGGKYYEDFFKNTKQKDYCFSVILPKCKFDKNTIQLEKSELKVIFSISDSKKLGLILFSSFIAQKNKPYPLSNNNIMILRSINRELSEIITSNKVIFKTVTGSGLCIRDHNKENNEDIYYIYSNDKFKEKTKIVLHNQLANAGFNEVEINNVDINPIQCRKVIVKHYKRYIDVTIGMIEVSGDKKILQYFYDTGFGSRKSEGFGMLNLVKQDLF